MAAARCVILYSEIDKIRLGTPELAMCLKAAVRAIAGDLDELVDARTLARIEEIGLRGEFTAPEQEWLRDTLLEAVGLGSDGVTDAAAG